MAGHRGNQILMAGAVLGVALASACSERRPDAPPGYYATCAEDTGGCEEDLVCADQAITGEPVCTLPCTSSADCPLVDGGNTGCYDGFCSREGMPL